jgi:hypothetical protein
MPPKLLALIAGCATAYERPVAGRKAASFGDSPA